jgi:hypothetical protein
MMITINTMHNALRVVLKLNDIKYDQKVCASHPSQFSLMLTLTLTKRMRWNLDKKLSILLNNVNCLLWSNPHIKIQSLSLSALFYLICSLQIANSWTYTRLLIKINKKVFD